MEEQEQQTPAETPAEEKPEGETPSTESMDTSDESSAPADGGATSTPAEGEASAA